MYPEEMQSEMYDKYISPYLEEKPYPLYRSYLLNRGMLAWLINVQDEDIEKMLAISKLCNAIYVTDEKLFTDLIDHISKEAELSNERTSSDSRIDYLIKTGNHPTEDRVNSILEVYKGLFENDFRLWGTIPFVYSTIVQGGNISSTDIDSTVHISAGEKLKSIKSFKTSSPHEPLKPFIDGIDNVFRNTGPGHDSYEIENEKIKLTKRDPVTGKLKGKIQEYAFVDLLETVEQCRRTLWAIETGFIVFLINNPSISKKLSETTFTHKPSSMKLNLEAFLAEKSLILKSLDLKDDRLNLVYETKIDNTGKNNQLFFGNKSYSLIKCIIKANYQDIVLGSLRYLFINFFKKEDLPTELHISVYDAEKNMVIDAYYNESSIQELTDTTSPRIPVPKKGELPKDIGYMQFGYIKVPVGKEELYIKLYQTNNPNCKFEW